MHTVADAYPCLSRMSATFISSTIKYQCHVQQTEFIAYLFELCCFAVADESAAAWHLAISITQADNNKFQKWNRLHSSTICDKHVRCVKQHMHVAADLSATSLCNESDSNM